MAEDNQTGVDGQPEPEQHAPTPKDLNGAKPRTFTQEEVDRIVNERLGRERGRKSDYGELKEKAGQAAEKPKSGVGFGKKDMLPYTIAVIMPFSNQFRRDYGALYDQVVAKGPQAIARTFDKTIMGTVKGPSC
jgi:hypothetical protein